MCPISRGLKTFFWLVGGTPAVCCYSQDTPNPPVFITVQHWSELSINTLPPPLLLSPRSSFPFQVSSVNDSLLFLNSLERGDAVNSSLNLDFLSVPCSMMEKDEGSCLHSWRLLIKSSLSYNEVFWDTSKAASGMWLFTITWRLNPKSNACNIYREWLSFPLQAKRKETPKVKQTGVLKVEGNAQQEKSNEGGWHRFIRYFVCDVFLLMSAYLQTRKRGSRAVVQCENEPAWQCGFLKARTTVRQQQQQQDQVPHIPRVCLFYII